MTWNDINLQNKYVSITKTLYKVHNNTPTSNKTAKNRQIYLPDFLVANLTSFKAIKEAYKDFSNNWYVFGDIKTISTTQLARKKHQYFTDANIREITIHEFRHSHCSMVINELLKEGKTSTSILLMLSQRLGHSLQVMERTYMHLFPNTQNDIVKMLNNLS